mmetsp:Transcript_66454/g.110508  ORF Transcript_66454/g.110508 Transcript_66454/m.110508 type:complete len:179 (-) Transcript_66454:99-635(-)
MNGSEMDSKTIQIFKHTRHHLLGITLEECTVQTRTGFVHRVVCASLQEGFGAAQQANGLRVGDVLHAINGKEVHSPEVAGMLLRQSAGAIKITITRAAAKPRSGTVTPWTVVRASGRITQWIPEAEAEGAHASKFPLRPMLGQARRWKSRRRRLNTVGGLSSMSRLNGSGLRATFGGL